MVNLFPDFVQHDTPPGRKASYLYIVMLTCSVLAAILYYSLATSPLIKTATSNDEFFSLEMYQGTTDCDKWYSCLYMKSQGANPSVSSLSCDCSSQAGKLSMMTQYPAPPKPITYSDWCENMDNLEKYAQTLPSVQTSRTSTQEDIRAFNLFSSQASCNSAHNASSAGEYISFSGTAQSTVLLRIQEWQVEAAAAIGVPSSLRFAQDTVPTATSVAEWLMRDTYLEVGVSANQAAIDKKNAESGLSKVAASGTVISLNSPSGDACNARLFWPLVVQINSRCREKKKEADSFFRAMDSTYIISSTLLNRDSYTKYHLAQRVLHSSNTFTTAALPPNTPPIPPGNEFAQYAMLGEYDYQENLDYLQLYYPLFTEGYALAFAEYTQTFVLQYYGDFHTGSASGVPLASNNPCKAASLAPGTNTDVSTPACQLTFTQTLKSVFPLVDSATGTNPSRTYAVPNGNPGVATRLRASVFHPTRTGGASASTAQSDSTNQAQPLTFKHIFGRGTLLTGSGTDVIESGLYHDLTPLTNDGSSINTASVLSNFSYTNGKYTITDTSSLKQKTKKCQDVPSPPPAAPGSTTPCGAAYTGWSAKVVSMSASITSLKVIWKHPEATQSDGKLRSEIILRQILTSLNASSTARPKFDIGVSSLSLQSGSTINLAFTAKKALKERQKVVFEEGGKLSSYTLPYLFQSIDTSPTTSNGAINPSALSVCTAELVGALKYTDKSGTLGSHPNFPPFPLCRSLSAASAAAGPVNMDGVPNPAQSAEGYLVTDAPGQTKWASWVTDDWTAAITYAPAALVKTVSSGSIFGHRSSAMETALNLIPKVYPLWDRQRVKQENLTFGYSYVTPNASLLFSPDFSLYWSVCNPHTCGWVATDTRTVTEIVTSVIAIAGGIAMACKTVAEIWKKMLKKKPNVVPIQHNIKVVVAGAQMTSDSVAKEE